MFTLSPARRLHIVLASAFLLVLGVFVVLLLPKSSPLSGSIINGQGPTGDFCPPGTIKNTPASIVLSSTSTADAGGGRYVHGMVVLPGTYALATTFGAVRYWPNATDNGGLIWNAKAFITYWGPHIFFPNDPNQSMERYDATPSPETTTTFYGNQLTAAATDHSRGTVINVHSLNGQPNVFIYIKDSYISDNQGSLTVESVRCGRNGDGVIDHGTGTAGTPAAPAPVPPGVTNNYNEQCDDGNANIGDGCDNHGQIEAGWTCSGSPSVCTTICGDNYTRGAEQCDDGNLANADGCDNACFTEYKCPLPYSSLKRPSYRGACWDHLVGEMCNSRSGYRSDLTMGFAGLTVDNCRRTHKHVDFTYNPTAQDLASEAVDPQGAGQSAACAERIIDHHGGNYEDSLIFIKNFNPSSKYSSVNVVISPICAYGLPSGAVTWKQVCGNGVLDSGEQCDDGSKQNGDGCSSTCRFEAGWTCNTAVSPSKCTHS